MNRVNAQAIKYKGWMQHSVIMELEAMGVEYAIGPCPQFGYRILWIDEYTPEIFTWNNNNGNGQKLDFIYGLLMWYDDGTQEVRITADNYWDYRQYELEFYMDRLGTYDQEWE